MSKKTDTPDTITYEIVVNPPPVFNPNTGKFELPAAYSTPGYVKYYERVTVQENRATTNDPKLALEFLDSGATVTPDPRPLLQEQYAVELEKEAEGNMQRLAELAKYVNTTNEWRKAHNLQPLTVKAPEVPRGISALYTTLPQR